MRARYKVGVNLIDIKATDSILKENDFRAGIPSSELVENNWFRVLYKPNARNNPDAGIIYYTVVYIGIDKVELRDTKREVEMYVFQLPYSVTNRNRFFGIQFNYVNELIQDNEFLRAVRMYNPNPIPPNTPRKRPRNDFGVRNLESKVKILDQVDFINKQNGFIGRTAVNDLTKGRLYKIVDNLNEQHTGVIIRYVGKRTLNKQNGIKLKLHLFIEQYGKGYYYGFTQSYLRTIESLSILYPGDHDLGLNIEPGIPGEDLFNFGKQKLNRLRLLKKDLNILIKIKIY